MMIRKWIAVAVVLVATSLPIGAAAHPWNGNYGGDVQMFNWDTLYGSQADDQVTDTHCVQPMLYHYSGYVWMAKSCGPIVNDNYVSSTNFSGRHYITGHWLWQAESFTAW